MSEEFVADVDAWVLESKRRLLNVFRAATQEVFFLALKPTREGGRLRVDTGFLRSSAQVTLDNPVLRSVPNPNPRQGEDDTGIKFPFDGGPISLVIAGADLENMIWMTFTANYAAAREFGAKGQPGDAFVRTAAGQWQDIVNQQVALARAS